MDNVIGGYKEYVILERDALNEFESKVTVLMTEGQNDHNVEQIRKAKVMIECIEWIKANNIYTQDFKFKN
jgi:hypothetical protein